MVSAIQALILVECSLLYTYLNSLISILNINFITFKFIPVIEWLTDDLVDNKDSSSVVMPVTPTKNIASTSALTGINNIIIIKKKNGVIILF